MTYFLTSSPFGADSPYLNPANRFIDLLRQAAAPRCGMLFVCSHPEAHAFTDHIAGDMKFALEAAGFSFSDFMILDGRNGETAPAMVRKAGLIVLAGGHVPTQNAFFRQIGLRALLADYQGTLIGISAGSMNGADQVYVQPEEPGEALSPDFKRFAPGLNVTKTMLLPHYQKVKHAMLDGLRLFEDITYPDSLGRTFYALPDGSFLLGQNGRETIYGEAYRIRDGALTQVCREGETLAL